MAHFYIVKVLGVVSVTLTLALITNGQMDLTKQPGAKGANVVSAVVDIIRHSCIFPDDKFFLRRLAYVESRDGVSGRTYRPGYDGGIWQVERYQFNATQHSPAIQKYFPQIQSLFGIDWTRVTWSDLRKPLYSGIASSLYTQTLSTSVPRGIEKQSMFWTHNYQSASTELSYNFTVASSLLSDNCQGNQTIDLAFILDGSSSVSPGDFLRAKEFVLHVIDIFTISLDDARVSVITYSDDAVVEMYLGANQTKEEVREQILNIQWRGGSTATGKALDLAADVVFTAAHGSRVGAPKAVILLSDGQSNDFYETKNAARRVREMGITVFAVGVGTILDLLELKEVASDPDCTHLFLVNSYDEIDTLVQEIQHASCRIPVVIGPTDVVVCELSKDNSCVYKTRNISAVQITVDCSTAILYSSYNNPYPGSAYYELTSRATTAQPVIIGVGTKGKPLYISVWGPWLHTGDGRRCYATLRPMTHEYTFELICRENGVDRECSIPADLFRYKPQICNDNWWDFTNPCTRSAVEQGKVVFPHPYNANMYLTCDLTGRVYIVICPSGTLFDQNSLQCGMGPRGNGTGHVDINPCTPEQLRAGNFFFPYLEDHHKYIHCDAWGHPWVMDCNGGFVWDQRELTCVEEFLVGVTPHPHYNPCTREMIAMGKLFFPYPDDNRHYIRCDAWGQAFVMPCEPGTVWNQQVSVCV